MHLADRTSEALEAIKEAEAFVERSEERWWSAELHRLRGVFLANLGTDEAQIEASLGEAVRIAPEQKSVSLEKRAEGTYAENSAGKKGVRQEDTDETAIPLLTVFAIKTSTAIMAAMNYSTLPQPVGLDGNGKQICECC